MDILATPCRSALNVLISTTYRTLAFGRGFCYGKMEFMSIGPLIVIATLDADGVPIPVSDENPIPTEEV